MKTRISTFAFCILAYCSIYSQKIIKLNLKASYNLNPFGYQEIPFTKEDYNTSFIDSLKYSVLLKGMLHYQPEQFTWDAYKSGLYKRDTINYIINTKKIDTSKLCINAVKEAVYVLALSNKQTGDSLLLFNNSLSVNISTWHTIDFKNISTNWLDLKKPETVMDSMPQIEVCFNGKVITHPVWLFPLLDKSAKKLARQISFVSSYYTSGYFEAGGKRIMLSVGNTQSKHYFDNDNTGIRIEGQNSQRPSEPYKIGDTIDVERYKVQLYRISPDAKTIMFKILGVQKKNIPGYNTGNQYRAFNLNDIVDGSKINTAELLQSKKYILLDFWGTWCGPCIKGIPSVRSIYETYNKDVQVISIAGEQKADTAKVLAAIAAYNMPWKHLMFYKNVKFNWNFLLDQYRITTYPTYILINSRGLIVQRQTGLDGTDSIKDFLLKSLGY